MKLQSEIMREMIQQYDAITVKGRRYLQTDQHGEPLTVYHEYGMVPFQHREDLDITLKILEEKYPAFHEAAQEYMHSELAHECNMFIMKKDLYFQYCQWLFDILFEVEKRIDISSYDSYQRRVFGFLSERLQNIYIEHLKRHTSARIIELPLVYWEADAKTFYKRKFKYVKRRFLRLIGLYHDKNHHHR